MVIGELGLDGRVKPVSGVLSLAAMAREKGIKRCFLPIENVAEGLVMEGVDMVGVESLGHMAGFHGTVPCSALPSGERLSEERWSGLQGGQRSGHIEEGSGGGGSRHARTAFDRQRRNR